MSRLCQYCRQINFDTLRGPTVQELRAITSGSTDNAGVLLAKAKDGVSYDKVHLGGLRRIRTSAASCDLCSLFSDVISKQGGTYSDYKGTHSVDSEDIYFRADPDLSYYARIVPREGDQSRAFVLRRLCLTAQEQDTDITVVYIDHAFQLCNTGELSKDCDELPPRHDSMPFGGRKRPSRVMIPRLTDWIQRCLSEHGILCQSEETAVSSRMETFRLIDVHQRCICEFHNVDILKLRFMALSYVWGQTQFPQLNDLTRESLQRPGALDDFNLPKTITDSMELVRRLEFRYLWVDGLCIVQDSNQDKSYQISHMADIYSLAFLTIVAASGVDADAGLAGLNTTRDSAQREVVVPHPHDFDEYYTRGQESVDLSRWAHRGWTLQETALPHRKLIFTDEQVFWSCHGAFYCEESQFEIPDVMVKHFNNSIHKVSLHALEEESVDPWVVYEQVISNFTRRDLTFDGDVASAFDAVTTLFERRIGASFLFGIPRPLFELGLMWETSHGVTRRTTMSTLPMPHSGEVSVFPSWSWMGWKGESCCRVASFRRETESPGITCFVHRRHPLRLDHVSKDSGKHTSILHGDDCIQANLVTLADIKNNIPDLMTEVLEQYPDEQLLFFWTRAATFSIKLASTSAPTSFKDYGATSLPEIKNSNGQRVGTVCRVRTGGPHGLAPMNSTSRFIQIGLRKDDEIPAEILPPQVLVMQIEQGEEGVSYRVNYGEINLAAWEEAEPQQCLVALG